jgi:glycosyltransferase involved in cell wall biosynthesis
MLPAVADAVQIVGRDPSALTPSVLAHLSTRVRYIDAWYDDTFCVSPFRNLDGPLRIFYAGRLAPMKNPELLLKVIETSQRVCGDSVEFRYFGADAAKIPDRFKEQFPSFGLLSAPELAEAISDCHVGILCSGFGEGSPFIVVEALACGRGFILPPLAGLLDSYRNHRGVMFAPDYSVDAFLDTLTRMQTEIRNGLTPEIIASDVRDRSKAIVVREILQGLEADHG